MLAVYHWVSVAKQYSYLSQVLKTQSHINLLLYDLSPLPQHTFSSVEAPIEQKNARELGTKRIANRLKREKNVRKTYQILCLNTTIKAKRGFYDV